jgi:hypothetical protein
MISLKRLSLQGPVSASNCQVEKSLVRRGFFLLCTGPRFVAAFVFSGGRAMASEGFVRTEDGLRLFFQKVGSGPETVLIPNGIYLFDDFEWLASERTLIFYDTRNRGRSDHVHDGSQLAMGIHHDVDPDDPSIVP